MRALLTLVFLTLLGIQLHASKYRLEKVQFYVDDSVKLDGMLYFPHEKAINKVIVCFSGSGLGFKTHADSLLYDYKIMEKLSNDGVGWLIFSSNFYKGYRPLNLFIYATDADSAISYLRHREDTKKCKIGILGQSEAGMAAAVCASRNSEVDFVISVTSFMIKGPDFMVENIFSNDNKATHGKTKTVFDGFKTILKDTFIYGNTKYLKTDENFTRCIKKCIDTICATFYQKDPIADIHFTNKTSDIQKYFNSSIEACKMFKDLWHLNDSLSNSNLKNSDSNTLNEINFLCAKLYNPHDMAFIQWNPEPYFPNISVPVLVLLGDKDSLMPFKKNLDGINDIIHKYNKKNITVKVFKNHKHGLVLSDNKTNNTCEHHSTTPDATANWMSNWIVRL